MFSERRQFIFSESERFAPERLERGRFLLDLARRGIKETKDTLGYLELTIPQLEYVMDTGFIPGPNLEDQPPLVYFTPTVQRAREIDPGVQKFDPRTRAEGFAWDEARAHAFLESWGGWNAIRNRNLSGEAATLFLRLDTYPHFVPESKKFFMAHFQMGPDELERLIESAEEYRGFVATVSREALNKFSTNESPETDWDMCGFTTSQGLPSGYLTGLKALGPWEKAYLEGLERKVGKP